MKSTRGIMRLPKLINRQIRSRFQRSNQDYPSPLSKLMERERFYMENGARLLKESISSCDGKENPIQMFSEEELERATNNYDDAHILVTGRMYTAYKGTHEGRPIVVRRLNFLYIQFIDNAFNEIIMLSQINHKNVVKLLGCCIETPDPRPVYEFISNGNLYNHLPASLISWECRLRIATEVASAINYLHSRSSKPIIHRDVRSLNVLLDENYTAKLTNFGNSETVLLADRNIEPDDMRTNGQTDALNFSRHDVRSFGMVLVDLLTGNTPQQVSNWDMIGGVRFFNSYIQEKKRLLSERRSATLEEGEEAQIYQWIACAELAMRCTTDDGVPMMKEVVQELTRIRTLKQI